MKSETPFCALVLAANQYNRSKEILFFRFKASGEITPKNRKPFVIIFAFS